MTAIRISGGAIHDPANDVDGEVQDLCLQDGKVVAHGDVPGQARQAAANLASALKAAGASLTDVLKTTIYVASGDRAGALGSARLSDHRFRVAGHQHRFHAAY